MLPAQYGNAAAKSGTSVVALKLPEPTQLLNAPCGVSVFAHASELNIFQNTYATTAAWQSLWKSESCQLSITR